MTNESSFPGEVYYRSDGAIVERRSEMRRICQENERNRLFREFEDARNRELENGQDPKVCLAGEHYYYALIGYMKAEFSMTSFSNMDHNYVEFRGIRVFKTTAFKTGFIMGAA